jgi:hypothetical protein
MKILIIMGVEIAMEIKVTENQKGQSCKNIQSRATGIFGHAKHRTKANNVMRVSGITFFRYAHSRMFAKPNSVFEEIKPKCLNTIAKIVYGHLTQHQKIYPQQRKLNILATRYDHRQCCNTINHYLT